VIATMNFLGDIYRSGLPEGRVEYGNYPVFDLSAQYFLDERQHNIVTMRIVNLFDESYAAGLGRAQRDVDGSNYTFWNLGVPRTFSLRYTYKF
jgi:outer membrane receptor for ferric coprogen and ferric-rhodotorulic acid